MSTPDPPNVWSRVYDDVKMQIPGVIDAVFWQMLYQVVNDFFDRTNIWTEECPINVGPDSLVYPFSISNYGMSNRLLLVYDPAAQDPDRKWVQAGIQMDKPGVITLRYAPSSATLWNVVVAKTLDTVSTDKYPDIKPADEWIVHKYGDGIHYGVLGRLQSMPGKPYSNPKAGGQNWQYYVTERSKARTDALKANVFGGQRWQFPQAFATVRRGGWA
jgi:hypothetical protein